MATFATFLASRTGSRAAKKTAPSKARIKTYGNFTYVETGVRCPACNEELSYAPDDQMTVECGGPGMGGCDESMLSYHLGTPKWKQKCEEYKFITDGAKFPSLETCLKIQRAIDKAATIGGEILAKR